MTTSEKCLIIFFHKRKSKTSNGCILPVVPAGIVNKTKSCADSGLFLSIISRLVHEFNNKTEFGSTFGKNTFFIQVSKWLDVSLPDFETIIKILFIVNMVSYTLGPNVPLSSFNTVRSGDNNLSSAEIIGCIM